MSLAERFGLRSHGTLHVVLGSAELECAVVTGHGRRLRWVEGTYRRFDLASTLPPSAAPAAELPSPPASAATSRRSPPVDPTTAVPAPWRDAIARLAADAETVPTGEIRVLVADQWLSVGSIPWSAASSRPDSAEVDARNRLTMGGFNVDAADTMRIDDCAFAEPHLAVAYPQALLAALAALADRLAVPLVSVSPLSAAAWACAARQVASTTAVAVIGDGFALLVRALGRSGRRASEVTVRVGSPGSDSASKRVGDLWRRCCLRHPELAAVMRVPTWDLTRDRSAAAMLPAPFTLLQPPPNAGGLTAPSLAPSPLLRLAAAAADDHHVVDAMPARAGHRPLRFAAVALALVAAVASGLQTERSFRLREQLAARVDALTLVAGTTSTRSQPWSREERARAQAVNAAVRDLNLPVVALLGALQPPRDLHVAVLSVETTERPSDAPELAGGAVRVVAEARDGFAMARYAAFVAKRRPFVVAYVVRHEVDETAVERPYRFTLEASWID